MSSGFCLSHHLNLACKALDIRRVMAYFGLAELLVSPSCRRSCRWVTSRFSTSPRRIICCRVSHRNESPCCNVEQRTRSERILRTAWVYSPRGEGPICRRYSTGALRDGSRRAWVLSSATIADPARLPVPGGRGFPRFISAGERTRNPVRSTVRSLKRSGPTASIWWFSPVT